MWEGRIRAPRPTEGLFDEQASYRLKCPKYEVPHTDLLLH